MDKKELLRLLELHTEGTGLFPEVMLAQMMTESGMTRKSKADGGKGLSVLSEKYHNYSGQKASGVTLKNGKEGVDYVIMGTEEDFNSEQEAKDYLKKNKGGKLKVGNTKTVKNDDGTYTVTLGQPFRIFESDEAGVTGHIRFLTGDGYTAGHKARYKEVVDAKTPEAQIKALKSSGYATDQDYVKTLTSVLDNKVRTENPQYSKNPDVKASAVASIEAGEEVGTEEEIATSLNITYTPRVAGWSETIEEPEEEEEYNPLVDDSVFVKPDIDTKGVPTEEEAKLNPDYSEDKSKQRESRSAEVEAFRVAFMKLDEENPNGEGSAQDELDFKLKVNKLIKENPVAIYFSDSFDGRKEELLINEDFLLGKSTDVYEKISSDIARNYTKFSGRIYNDTYYNETVLPRVKEVDEYEYKKPKINVVGTTASGASIVTLPSGRTTTIQQDEELTTGITQDTRIKPENIAKGEADNKARIQQMLKDTGSYNEDGTLITEAQTKVKQDAEDKLNQDKLDAANSEKKEGQMRKAEMALTGLKAAAGILSLSQALRAPDVETPELDPLIYEALSKQKALSESGLTAKEKGAAMQNMGDAYAGAMKNVLRASGGQRGMYLANQGTVDAQRIQGLNQLAAQDAAVHRENIKEYNSLATSVGSMKLNRDMNVEQMRQATLSNNRQILSGVGSNLLSDAISDVSYYMNPNRKATEDLIKNLSGKKGKDDGYDNRLLNDGIKTANIIPKDQSAIDKEAAANAKNTTN